MIIFIKEMFFSPLCGATLTHWKVYLCMLCQWNHDPCVLWSSSGQTSLCPLNPLNNRGVNLLETPESGLGGFRWNHRTF